MILCIALITGGCGAEARESPTDPPSGIDAGRTEVDGVEKPAAPTPEGPPARKLEVRDIEVGSGPRAKAGDTIRLEYIGTTWTGSRFSDSWTYSSSPVFELGSQRLEYGLDLGTRGMRAGGRREVVVPGSLIYWPDEKHAPVRPSNAIIFIVDLFEVR